jgi:predicted peroxiredoxin
MPAVVRECGEERLIDGAALELGCEVVKCEHVEDRVLLALEPELVPQTAAVRYVVALRLTCVGDDRVVVGRGDGAHTVSESAREEVVPGRVPVIRFRRVTVEELLKGVRVAGCIIRDGCQVGSTMWAEPTAVVVTEALLRRRFRLEEAPPHIQNLLEHRVDLRVEEEREAAGGPHRPVERSADGHADHSDPLRLVGPRWARGDKVVEDLEEVGVIADLHVTGGVIGIRFLVGHLVEHGRDEAVYTGVRLDKLLELFEDGVEGRRILVDVVDDAL